MEEEDSGVSARHQPPPTSQTLITGSTGVDLPPTVEHGSGVPEPPEASFTQSDILKAIKVVERDSAAIAQSFTSLFASLRVALSDVTSSSVDHMQLFSDAAGRLQESAIDAATKGNRYINSCVRLNEEIKGIDALASQLYPSNLASLKVLRRNVDALDSSVNKLLRPP